MNLRRTPRSKTTWFLLALTSGCLVISLATLWCGLYCRFGWLTINLSSGALNLWQASKANALFDKTSDFDVFRVTNWDFHSLFPMYTSSPGVFDAIMRLPLWIPLVLAASLCAYFWRRDSLAFARIGTCPNCNYNRSGLSAAAICPECGQIQ